MFTVDIKQQYNNNKYDCLSGFENEIDGMLHVKMQYVQMKVPRYNVLLPPKDTSIKVTCI